MISPFEKHSDSLEAFRWSGRADLQKKNIGLESVVFCCQHCVSHMNHHVNLKWTYHPLMLLMMYMEF